MTYSIRHKRGTTSQWANSTYVLKEGELGIDKTLNKIKIGNGSSLWTALPYVNAVPTEISEMSQDAIWAAVNHSDHNHVSVTYDDIANKIIFSTEPEVVINSGLTSTLGDYLTTTAFNAQLDDPNGTPTLDSNGFIRDTQIPAGIARDTEIPSLTGYATETYVTTAISNLVDAAPGTLNTLNEIAAAINDDASYAATITTALGNKLDNNYVTIGNTLLEGISGQSYGLIGTSTYLDVKNTNGYNKEIELDIAAVESKLDTDGYIKQAALDNKANLNFSFNTPVGNYTMQLSDNNKIIEMSNALNDVILSVPTNSVAFPIGASITVVSLTDYLVTIAPLVPATTVINATPGLKLRAKWSSVTLVKRSNEVWYAFGDLKV